MMNIIKKYWIVILLLIGIGGIYSWYDPNYCYKEGKKYTDADFRDGQSNSEIARHLAYEYRLAREIGRGEFDENDMRQLEAEVNEFYNKYPNYKRGGVNQKAEAEFYAFRSFQYFFPPKEIDRINDYLKKDRSGNSLIKRVVGCYHLQYYGPCGHISWVMDELIYEGDKSDLGLNPYETNNTINKEH